MSDYQEGDYVAYIPYHAGGRINHPDVEYGEVTGKNNSYIFVKFKGDNFSKAVIRERLHRVA